MRYLGLMITLLIIALLVSRQLSGPETSPSAAAVSVDNPPQVPQRPQDLQGFKQDMDTYVNQANEQSRQRIEQATQ